LISAMATGGTGSSHVTLVPLVATACKKCHGHGHSGHTHGSAPDSCITAKKTVENAHTNAITTTS